MKLTLAERFWSKVARTPNGCWLWLASKHPRGYGHFLSIKNGKRVCVNAHRVAYELVKGPIPEGTEIDHLCRNTSCVNPDHLEAVTHKINVLRGESKNAINARKTHCQRGHPLVPGNLYMQGTNRKCRTCVLQGMKAIYQKRKNNNE